ncbi:hypothetical protein, partial [Oceanobacillus alkalisoli]|uniref:hypothetical protein n=1 Tax=Oceanobacillus alkalisoli TaxID=2925113 RepID=UPI001F11B061|nr:hypothetical protein [Oceanobacillus alkalisoli]
RRVEHQEQNCLPVVGTSSDGQEIMWGGEAARREGTQGAELPACSWDVVLQPRNSTGSRTGQGRNIRRTACL